MFYKALKCRCLHTYFLLYPPPPCPIATSVRKERQVIEVGNSLLRGAEDSIHWTDPSLMEVCTLPGAWVQDITRKIPSLVQPSEYYPLLLFLVGGNESTIPLLRAVKSRSFASAIVLAQWIMQTCFCHRRAKFNWHTFLLQNCYCNACSILHLSLVIALSRWGPSPNHIKLILRTLKQLKETTSLPPAIK